MSVITALGIFQCNYVRNSNEILDTDGSRLSQLSALIKYLVYHYGNLGRLQLVTFGGYCGDVNISGEYASRNPVVGTEAESGSRLTKYRLSKSRF